MFQDTLQNLLFLLKKKNYYYDCVFDLDKLEPEALGERNYVICICITQYYYNKNKLLNTCAPRHTPDPYYNSKSSINICDNWFWHVSRATVYNYYYTVRRIITVCKKKNNNEYR